MLQQQLCLHVQEHGVYQRHSSAASHQQHFSAELGHASSQQSWEDSCDIPPASSHWSHGTSGFHFPLNLFGDPFWEVLTKKAVLSRYVITDNWAKVKQK